MDYTSNRERIKSGDLIALTHKKWGSLYDLQVQAVRLGTESEYSHVGLIWEIGGRLFVIESVVPFVRILPLAHYAKEGFYWLSMNAPISDDELEFAMDDVGTWSYSKWQAILAFFKRLKIGADRAGMCAEFVIECRRRSGVDLGDFATPSAVVFEANDRYGAAALWLKNETPAEKK
jgi:hypothetical protein